MEFIPSPNFGPRRVGAVIQHLILHYTDTPTAAMAIDMLRDPVREVSAHYMVDLDGRIIQMVDEAQRAWHAGKSFWAGETDINSTSIGIEIVNPGHTFGHAPFPPEQISAVIKLCQEILARHPAILPQSVLAHSDIAPERKQDPGALFPWKILAAAGVGLWPEPTPPHAATEHELKTYGYDVSNLPAAITAFQRHFRTERINGTWDTECSAQLAALLARIQRA